MRLNGIERERESDTMCISTDIRVQRRPSTHHHRIRELHLITTTTTTTSSNVNSAINVWCYWCRLILSVIRLFVTASSSNLYFVCTAADWVNVKKMQTENNEEKKKCWLSSKWSPILLRRCRLSVVVCVFLSLYTSSLALKHCRNLRQWVYFILLLWSPLIIVFGIFAVFFSNCENC